MQKIINALATGFYISYLPALVIPFKKNTGAGFLGTLLAVPFVFILPTDFILYLVFLLAFWVAAVWVCKQVKLGGNYKGHDNPRIVIDEMAGYFTAVMFLPRTWPYLLAAFVLFRTVDTLKPWPVKNFDRMENPFGVVFDDVAGGLLVNIALQLFIIFSRSAGL
ncbi:MAG TPA: phosphatidylglycerophosphatase A [Candidatus Avelusimicrobium excrementipullorum]|nr:phosphatidylglycerophosphatase A [Candidatus Avelusimicrobium excrementipullorum]